MAFTLKIDGMKDRIKKVMETQHMSQKVFAQFTGISEGSLSGVFNGRTRPTLQMVESIHARLPQLSVEWLMFGTGPMYIDEASSGASSDQEKKMDSPTLLDVQSLDQNPSLFTVQEQSMINSAQQTPLNTPKTIVKYIDKPERHITEIRIFFDDQTWETFEPKR